jgi:hypothetical protein
MAGDGPSAAEPVPLHHHDVEPVARSDAGGRDPGGASADDDHVGSQRLYPSCVH